MVKLFVMCVLSIGVYLSAGQPQKAFAVANVIVVADVHPAEAKYDKIMNRYADGLIKAFSEKDDNKTILILQELNDEMVAEIVKIEPELKQWINGMSEEELEAVKNRIVNKPYMKAIFGFMFNPEISKRIESNPKLKEALEDGDKRMKELSFGDDNEEVSDEEDYR